MASVAAAQAEPNLWQTLLGQAMRAKRDSDGTLLVVGDPGSGKRALVQCLRECVPDELLRDTENARASHQSDSGVVRYTYFPVIHPDDKDADVDTSPTCNVWSLSQRRRGSFLDCALDGGVGSSGDEGALLRTVVMIVLDFERPSGMIASLEGWLETIEKEIGPRMQQYASQDKMVQSLRDHVRLYRVKMRSGSSSTSTSVASRGDSDAKTAGDLDNVGGVSSTLDEIELPEGVLTTNLGVPIIVCCSKTDVIGTSNMRQQPGSPSAKSSKPLPEDCADYVQQHLREICIKYGAALFFTSSKTGTNIAELHQYLMHRMYPNAGAFQFDRRAEVVNSTNILIPSGFDMPQLIADMKGDILEGTVDTVLADYGLPPVANPPPSMSQSEASCDERGGTETNKGVAEVNNVEDVNTVTAYSEQDFLERLLKRQLAEDRVLGTHTAVDEMKLRDEVRSMDVTSSAKSSSSRRSTRVNAKVSSDLRAGGSDGRRTSSATGSTGGRRTRSTEADTSTSSKGVASAGTSSSSSSSSSSNGTHRTTSKSGGSGLASGGGDAGSKDNPKLIKNFFQSLLKPRAGGGDKSSDKSSSSSGGAVRRSSRTRKPVKK
eukprot:g440.t1